MSHATVPDIPAFLSRRQFVAGLAGSALLSASLPRRSAAAGAATLSGTQFDLEIGAVEVDFTGRRRSATVVNGHLPGPVLRWREGDSVCLRVTNRLSAPTSIHWHGMIVPADMDGVPEIGRAHV